MEGKSAGRISRETGQLLSVVLFLVLLLGARGVVAPRTLSPVNLLEILRQASPLGLVAIGQTMALLIGGIDLSVSSVITLTNVLAARMMVEGDRTIPVTVLAVALIAACIGAANGLLIVFIRIPPIITTLAMGIIIQGVYYIYTRGAPIGNIAPGFRVVADGHIAGLPWAMLIWAALIAAAAVLLRRTRFGRQLYATGASPQVARLSGIPHRRTIVSTYMLCSLFACFAGLMLSAYIGVASTSVGNGYDLSSIAAAVIGGTTFAGGEGGLAGTVAGVLVLVLLNGLLTIVNISDAGKLMAQGAIIILMMATQGIRRRQ
jgi:ribose/xylose/arabinose/galactoside ABC-type transport system permease subunit